MKVIVPVDFSAQSINTAVVASQMLDKLNDTELVLYHLYQEDTQEAFVKENLQKIKDHLQRNSDVKIQCLTNKGDNLIKALTTLLYSVDATLVVMCVRHSKVYEDSTAVQILAQSCCPVLVIPDGYLYNKINTVALASDFNAVGEIVPFEKVKKVLNIFKPQLHLVHVSTVVDVFYSDEPLSQRKQLEEMFQEYQPKFNFIPSGDFAKALNEFVEFEKIDLVLTFPRKHNFLTTLIKGTNTRKLVYKNTVPVLAAHE